MTYDQAVAALGQMQARGWRLELDRMVEFCDRLGVPGGGTPAYIHVAGTNGKGAVTCYAQNILASQGHRTGGYYSPFVYDLRERVQIGLSCIGKEQFAKLMDRIVPVSDALVETGFGGPTEFEAKTALGFLAWQEAGTEAVALEVGLGGRLDATNVVDPACSVIVSIGFDHMHFLGDTLALIAREKAGIIKEGRPLVIGDLVPEALEAVTRVAMERKSPTWQFGRDVVLSERAGKWSLSTPHGTMADLAPGMTGVVQPHNMALAWAAVEAAGLMRDKDAARTAVAEARLPGRFEIHRSGTRIYVVDGAHNAEAARAVVDTLRSRFADRRVGVLVGMQRGHEPAPFLSVLADVAERCAVTTVPSDRTMPTGELAVAALEFFPDVQEFEDAAAAAAWLDTDVMLVTGSFYLLGAAKRSLGLPDWPPCSG